MPRKGNVNNTLPELKAFKRAPSLRLSQWENGNLTTNLAEKKGPKALPANGSNLASIDLSLSADQLKALDEASRIDLGFPYNLYAKEMARSLMHGGMGDQIVA